MSSAPSTDARTLVAEMKRQLHQCRAEHLQLEAGMRWRLERDLEASRAEHAALVARMTSSIAKLERATVTGTASSIAGLEPAPATPTGAEVPIDQAPSSSQPAAHQAAVLSLPRPTPMPATADAILPVDWTPQSPICCLLPDELLERIAEELQSGVVWQTCAFLWHRRLNSIEALVLSSCKLQILEVPIGGSRDALVLRLWHQLNVGRSIMRQLRSAVSEVAAAADHEDGIVRFSDPWKSRFATIDLIRAEYGLGLNELAPDVRRYFAGDLPALLRDERGGPPAVSSWCVDGGIKQAFFEHLRDSIYSFFLASQAEPHRARLLIQAAEDIIDPCIEQAAKRREPLSLGLLQPIIAANRRTAERRAAEMMRLLREFVRNNDYLLSDRQNKACCLMINSPTISETARDCAIKLLEENAAQMATAQAAALPSPSCTPSSCSWFVGGFTYHSITILMDSAKSFEELRFEDYCRANAPADSVDPNQDPSWSEIAVSDTVQAPQRKKRVPNTKITKRSRSSPAVRAYGPLRSGDQPDARAGDTHFTRDTF